MWSFHILNTIMNLLKSTIYLFQTILFLFILLPKQKWLLFHVEVCFVLMSEGESWIFHLVILILHLVVGHQVLLTTLTLLTHINHVHIASTLIIRLKIVHPSNNFPIFHMGKWTPVSLTLGLNQTQIFITRTGATILIYCGKLMLQEITLPKLTNYTILNIHSSTTNFLPLHRAIILLNNLHWKTLSMRSGK